MAKLTLKDQLRYIYITLKETLIIINSKNVRRVINFKEFLEEGKRNKQIEKLTKEFKKDAKRQRKEAKRQGGPVSVDYGNHPVGSPEREAAIRAMMSRQGGGAFKKQ